MPDRSVHILDATPADFPAIIAMNDAAVPNVNAFRPGYFEWLREHAAYFRVAVDDVGVAGFVLCLASGGEYWSENYLWFAERYERFLYLDRVVVAERSRGRGVGAALYADLHEWCEGRYSRVTLEVNLRPPNDGSVRFHERMGYERVGVREYDGGEHAVIMYARPA